MLQKLYKMKDHVTEGELKALLHLSHSQMQRLRKDGTLVPVKKRPLLYKKENVYEYLEVALVDVNRIQRELKENTVFLGIPDLRSLLHVVSEGKEQLWIEGFLCGLASHQDVDLFGGRAYKREFDQGYTFAQKLNKKAQNRFLKAMQE